jgi:hypothetical protein
VVRFARLIHRPVRVLGVPSARAAIRRQSDPGLVATQGGTAGFRSSRVRPAHRTRIRFSACRRAAIRPYCAFALLYWELDSGGAAARAHRLPRHADFAFPQQLNPDIAPAGWRPRFIDYLYLGFTNATAFSPTDTMPLAPWAKVAMTVQSLISLAILGLVVARAVNVFS